MNQLDWITNKVTEPLRKQISEYVEKFIEEKIPTIPFDGYKQFIKTGSRKESETYYFGVRRQLTALGLYLQWNSSEKFVEYFNELLWSVSNEFTWCLAAHISYGDDYFKGEPDKNIDLFAAETAATLSELCVLHADIIHPYIKNHIIKRVQERILTPFLEKNWGWETSLNNWCAVCSGSVGMSALLLESGDRKQEILDKVENAMTYYLKCFDEDGATEEGIGYWAYGFGYYIYYIAMRKEMDENYVIPEEVTEKLKKIAEFPHLVQMTETTFIPFSDASASTILPTGLVSYLHREFGATPPICSQITSFDFDHCYRFAHISRNLWWTRKDIFDQDGKNTTKYFKGTQWLVSRQKNHFFAMKGGHNQEEHNHNDVGNFVYAIGGELFLTDLGAGPYTADYFGAKRYEYPHTRSYWHNVPLINEQEQKQTANPCTVTEIILEDNKVGMTMELSKLYLMSELNSVTRTVISDMRDKTIVLKDNFDAKEEITLEEGFISAIKPEEKEKGLIQLKGRNGVLELAYDVNSLKSHIEVKELNDHLGHPETYYRIGIRVKEKVKRFDFNIRISLI